MYLRTTLALFCKHFALPGPPFTFLKLSDSSLRVKTCQLFYQDFSEFSSHFLDNPWKIFVTQISKKNTIPKDKISTFFTMLTHNTTPQMDMYKVWSLNNSHLLIGHYSVAFLLLEQTAYHPHVKGGSFILVHSL